MEVGLSDFHGYKDYLWWSESVFTLQDPQVRVNGGSPVKNVRRKKVGEPVPPNKEESPEIKRFYKSQTQGLLVLVPHLSSTILNT